MHLWAESELWQQVSLNFHARGDLLKQQTRVAHAEHSRLSDVQHLLPRAPSVVCAERDLGNLVYDLRRPGGEEAQLSAVDRRLGTDRQGAAEDDLVCLLDNVDKTAHSNDLGADLADVDVARAVDLQEAQESLVHSPAVVEVEHVTGL